MTADKKRPERGLKVIIPCLRCLYMEQIKRCIQRLPCVVVIILLIHCLHHSIFRCLFSIISQKTAIHPSPKSN